MLERADFAGAWGLERQITDRLGHQNGQMRGGMTLTPRGQDVLDYTERGTMQLQAGPELQATRAYVWRFVAGGIDVTFADGTAFHRFIPAGIVAGTDHRCGDDDYRVAYDFSRWPDWTATWDVVGPRKDYTSVSAYRR